MGPENFEKKLYIARDIEGNPNDEELEIMRQLENQLSFNESFVGIAPFGSVVEGYSTAESDLDFFVLYDGPWGIKRKNENTQARKCLGQQIEKWQEMMKKEHKMTNVIFENVNPELVIQSLKLGLDKGEQGKYVATTLAEMSRRVTGKKIERYRREITAEIQNLTAEQKEALLADIVESLSRRESLSLKKRTERLSELSEEDQQNILAERKEMWRHRAIKIWGLTED